MRPHGLRLVLLNIINDLADGIPVYLQTPKMKPNCEWLVHIFKAKSVI